jgi:Spy/CpxP family protein refolding chaperone
MNKAQKMVLALAGVGLFALGSSVLVAQDGGGGGGSAPGGGGGGGGGRQGGGGGGGGGRGNFNMEEIRKQMAERVKNDLGASDEDWKALGPAVEKVTQLRMQSMAGMGGGRGMRGGGPGGGGPGGGGPGGGGPGGGGDTANRPPESETQKASSELRKLLEDKGATNEDIKAKLTALRVAREKAKVELTKAQGELKEMVTPRQEAVLVNMGLLE